MQFSPIFSNWFHSLKYIQPLLNCLPFSPPSTLISCNFQSNSLSAQWHWTLHWIFPVHQFIQLSRNSAYQELVHHLPHSYTWFLHFILVATGEVLQHAASRQSVVCNILQPLLAFVARLISQQQSLSPWSADHEHAALKHALARQKWQTRTLLHFSKRRTDST